MLFNLSNNMDLPVSHFFVKDIALFFREILSHDKNYILYI